MTEKKTTKSSKKPAAGSKPVSPTKKRDVELTEKELARASGGIQWSGSGGAGRKV
jgi:hypothetical protein